MLVEYISIIILVFLHFSVEALLQILPLKSMVENSQYIIIGEVINVELVLEDKEPHLLKYGTIKVLKEIKSQEKLDKIKVAFIYYMEDEPDIKLNEKCIFFIKKFNERYTIVQGDYGKIKIKDKTVFPYGVLDEKKMQSVDGFVEKIEKIISAH